MDNQVCRNVRMGFFFNFLLFVGVDSLIFEIRSVAAAINEVSALLNPDLLMLKKEL